MSELTHRIREHPLSKVIQHGLEHHPCHVEPPPFSGFDLQSRREYGRADLSPARVWPSLRCPIVAVFWKGLFLRASANLSTSRRESSAIG